MEKEGLERAVRFLKEKGLEIATLITDHHLQIQKYVREMMTTTQHFYDIWHVAKGLRRKLESLAKEKECEVVGPCIRSIVNHIYWSASSTPSGDPDVMVEKWKSVINHIQNIHHGHGEIFPQFQHATGEACPKRRWIKSGTKASEKLGMLLEKPHLCRDMKKLSPLHQTSTVETFHKVIIHFAPKMVGISYMGMLSRLYLAALHYNENGSRTQAVDAAGEARFQVSYPKYKKGRHVFKALTTDMTFEYVEQLLTEVVTETGKNPQVRMKQQLEVPRPLSFDTPKISKKLAVEQHVSRSNKT